MLLEVLEEVSIEEGAVDRLVSNPSRHYFNLDSSLLNGLNQGFLQDFDVLDVGLDNLNGRLGFLYYV